jgi:hypothetical protein
MVVTKVLRKKIRAEYEAAVACNNELWRLLREYDHAMDNLEAVLETANLIETNEDEKNNDNV